MKNHRFPWLRNRTTDNRKCEKARNIKEKRTIEMFNQVLNLLVVHHSSASDNYKETTKKIQTQEMLIFPGFSLCPLICGTPQKSINFLR